MRVTQDWATANGVNSETSTQFVSAFYSSLATTPISSAGCHNNNYYYYSHNIDILMNLFINISFDNNLK